MGYFPASRGALPPRFAPKGVRLRVDNGGTYLGSLYSLIQTRYPSYTAPTTTTPTTTTTTSPTTIKLTTSPTPTSPVPIPTTFFSPTTAPTTTPTSAPPPPPPSYTPVPPPPSDPYGSTSNGTVDAGAVAQAAAPIIGAISPAAGAAAALLPAFSEAASQGPTSQVRFSDGSPDLSLPEVYNADGSPVTATAKAATLADKIKALPPAAKIGGAVALYLLFGR